MAAGLRVRNDAGSYQIDQDYSGFGLLAKGTIPMTLDPATHPQPMRIGSVSVTGETPMIAFKAPGHAVNLVRQANSGSSWTFHFRSQSSSDYTLSYWVFDNAKLTGGDTIQAGLKVRRANGEIAWHSGMRPLRIASGVDLTPPTEADLWNMGAQGPRGPKQIVEVPAGRTYAALQGSFCFATTHRNFGVIRDPDGGTTSTFKQMVLTSSHSAAVVSDTQVEAGLFQFEYFQGSYPSSTEETVSVYGDLMFWVIDVTGL